MMRRRLNALERTLNELTVSRGGAFHCLVFFFASSFVKFIFFERLLGWALQEGMQEGIPYFTQSFSTQCILL